MKRSKAWTAKKTKRLFFTSTCDPPTSNRRNQQDAKCNYNMGLAFASMNCDERAVIRAAINSHCGGIDQADALCASHSALLAKATALF